MLSSAPLTRAERDRVQRFLGRTGGGIKTFEALDGFFAALLSCPELTPPSRFLPEILGDSSDKTTVKSTRELQGLLDLILRHWNTVSRALAEQDPYEPALTAGGSEETAGGQWALGYRLGIKAQPRSWQAIRRHLRHGKFLRAILALADESGPVAAGQLRLEQDPESPAGRSLWRGASLEQLGANVTRLYRQLEPARRRAAAAAISSSDPKRAPADPAASGPPDRWEIGLLPVPGMIDGNSRARPVALVVAAGTGEVIHMQMESYPPADEADLAELVAREVGRLAGKAGVPPVVWLRDPITADRLRRKGPLAQSVIELRATLPLIEDFGRGLSQEFGGPAGMIPVAHAGAWRGWGLAPATVKRLFAAAAGYYRAAPWTLFGDDQRLDLAWPDGTTWAASALGAAGEQNGLSLFLNPNDFEALLNAAFDDAPLGSFTGMAVSVVYSTQAEVSPALRKEVQAGGWEVAGPAAHPELMVINSPTAGISEGVAGRVADALAALARMAKEITDRPDRRRSGVKVQGLKVEPRRERVAWQDSETGLRVTSGGR